MKKQKYKYEVGFSFLKQDEQIAYKLNDNIQDRLSTFIYSKKQEELSGTDGEKMFNEVFYEQSRVVVILYRNGWGQTPWTQIEETAIKNRAFEKGWDFLLIVNLDKNSRLPKWIPKTYIWLDYPRFKTEGAIAVIEHKVKEAGGQIRPETIEDKAERLKRHIIAEKERKKFLESPAANQTARQELILIVEKLKQIKSNIEDSNSYLLFASNERQNPPMYEIGFQGHFLCFNNCNPFEFDISSGKLKVTLYEKSGERYINYNETIHKQIELKFDRDLIGQNGWSDYETGENFIKSDDLVDEWIKIFIDGLGK